MSIPIGGFLPIIGSVISKLANIPNANSFQATAQGRRPINPIWGQIGGNIAETGMNFLGQALQNRYNSPAMQIKRLNKAGLPYAAFESNQAGSQTTLPDTTGIGRAGEAIANHMVLRTQQQQYELLKQQTRKLNAEAEAAEYEAILKKEDVSGQVGMQEKDKEGNYHSIRARGHLMDYKMKKLNVWMSRNNARISNVNAAVQESLQKTGTITATARAQLMNLLMDNKVMAANLRTEQNRNAAMNTLIEHLKKDGMSVWESLMVIGAQAIQ